MFMTRLKVYDTYKTPDDAWEAIKEYIPEDKIIWEPFYLDGDCHLNKMGFNVIHKNLDFFKSNFGEIIVSNPPFSIKKQVLEKMYELDKPFILIMPCFVLTTKYYEKFISKTSLLIPNKRIQFSKDGKTFENKCSLDCFYYCYKIF